MFRWILLSQALIYLIVMPLLRAQGEAGYQPPILVGMVGVVALFAGMRVQGPPRRWAQPEGAKDADKLVPREPLWIAVVVLAMAYCILSFQLGLLNRRQGSEMMAEIFGTMPLWQLAIIRGYELFLVPLIILYAFAGRRIPLYERIIVGSAVLFSLPFMGISDSRGRLLVLAISILAFIPAHTFFKYAISNAKAYIVTLMALGSFIYFSMIRASVYYSLKDYIQIEMFQRLDGLNLITKLRDAKLLSYSGEFDILMLSPIVSKIPFLEAAREAKLMGRTSSKQYYIQDVLRDRNLDDSNSMITDPLYFGGIAGLIICFFVFGYVITRFDSFIARGRLFDNRAPTALAIAFGTSFIMFENDFVSALVAFLQAVVFGALLVWMGCQRPLTITPRSLVDSEAVSHPT